MHEIQERLLTLARLESLDGLSFRQIAARIGCEHGSQAKHHIEQLVKHGYLVRNGGGELMVMGKTRHSDANVVAVPVLGEADCGEATTYASDAIRSYLRISPSVAGRTAAADNVFALKARGTSMNNAQVAGSKAIDNGDYILVQRCERSDVRDKDYVVSLIEGMANVKRLRLDPAHHRIVLMPESHDPHSPIIIAEEDTDYYRLIGKVVDVIKGVDALA